MTGPAPDPKAFTNPWLVGVMLGAINGVAVLSLGFLILPLLGASLLLIAWKGPRLIAGSGFLTGAGLLWAVAFLRVALMCGGPLDTGSQGTCGAGDLTGWIVGSLGLFVVGLVGSAYAFKRERER